MGGDMKVANYKRIRLFLMLSLSVLDASNLHAFPWILGGVT